MPQATRSDDHRTYRCYLRGPDGIRELSPCGPGASRKLFQSPRDFKETGPSAPKGGAPKEHALNPSRCAKHLQCARAAPPLTHDCLDRDHIKTDRDVAQAVSEEVVGGDHFDLAALAPIDRCGRPPVARASPRLDLDEDHEVTPANHEVDLPASETVVTCEDAPATTSEIALREPLPPPAQLVGCVPPLPRRFRHETPSALTSRRLARRRVSRDGTLGLR